MSKKKADFYLYSTLTSSMHYTNHQPGGADLPERVGDGVHVAGGANLPDKYLRTPDGAVITPISAEELAYLQENEVFRMHEKNGFIQIKDKSYEPEKVAGDMETRDKSAPLVDQDFEAENQTPPTTGKPGDDNAPKNSRKA